MSSFGFPSDAFAQSSIHAVRKPVPPAPIPPQSSSGQGASSPEPRAKVVAWEAPVVTTLSIGVST